VVFPQCFQDVQTSIRYRNMQVNLGWVGLGLTTSTDAVARMGSEQVRVAKEE
jgi:hypothetical protein